MKLPVFLTSLLPLLKASKIPRENKSITDNYSDIKKERDKLGITLMSLPSPIFVLDPNKNIVFINHAASKIIKDNSSLGQPVGKILTVKDNLNTLTPETYLLNQLYHREAIKVSAMEGEEHIVNLSAKKIESSDELGLGWIISMEDATEQKEAEQMKLDFVSMAAHELRTPITSIKGYLDVFIKENQGKFSEDHQMLLNQIKNSSLHLSSLVDNLLNITKIERGAFSVNLETVDLVQIARQIYSELIFRAQSKNQTLTFEEPNITVPQVQADKIRIGEVIANFTANAINYTQNGGQIKIWMELKDNLIIFHISDNGPGIPKDQVGKLFQKFYRVHGQLTQKTNGTGLGLFISRNIIELHHGKVWVDSVEGKGTTFSFYIPKAQQTTVELKTETVADALKIIQSSNSTS